jgi:hypothetical protein
MDVVVFLGPSLPLAEANEILPAIYLPPVAQAEFLSAVTRYRPDVIGLIDGVFSQSLSVWHKEILFALEQGIAVYGASSMGALRAIETEVYGAIGIGEVFRMYASGEITDDDEVALTHGPPDTGYRKMSEPMVNIRKTLGLARDRSVISADAHDVLVRSAKATFYPNRSFERLFDAATALEVPAPMVADLRDFVTENYVDVKRQDAVELLETIRDLPGKPGPRHDGFTMTRSHLFLAQYERDRTVQEAGIELPMASIGFHAALHLANFSELNSSSLNRALVGVLAEILEVDVDQGEIDSERERLRVRLGIGLDGDLEDWLLRNDLSPDEFHDLLRSLAVCRKMQRWLITRRYLQRTTKVVLDELRIRGEYERAKKDAAAVERVLAAQFPGFENFDYDNLTMPDLVVDHLAETTCHMDCDYATWAEEAGFKDLYDLRYELLRTRLVRRRLKELAAETAAAMTALSPTDVEGPTPP